jgi:hypothetical protein
MAIFGFYNGSFLNMQVCYANISCGVYSYNNIFILPPQYIFSMWTKYAKKKSITLEKHGNKGSLTSQ